MAAFDQSQMMARALENAGKPVELVRLDGEDHWLSNQSTRLVRLVMLQRFAAFLSEFLD